MCILKRDAQRVESFKELRGNSCSCTVLRHVSVGNHQYCSIEHDGDGSNTSRKAGVQYARWAVVHYVVRYAYHCVIEEYATSTWTPSKVAVTAIVPNPLWTSTRLVLTMVKLLDTSSAPPAFTAAFVVKLNIDRRHQDLDCFRLFKNAPCHKCRPRWKNYSATLRTRIFLS